MTSVLDALLTCAMRATVVDSPPLDAPMSANPEDAQFLPAESQFLHNPGIGSSRDGAVLYVSDWNGVRAVRLR